MHCRYLEENVGALAVKLSPEDMQELEAAFPQDKVRPDACLLLSCEGVRCLSAAQLSVGGIVLTASSKMHAVCTVCKQRYLQHDTCYCMCGSNIVPTLALPVCEPCT